MTDLGSLRTEIGHVCSLVVGCYFKRAPGACRGLFEDQHDLFLSELLLLCSVPFRGFQFAGKIKEANELLLRKQSNVEQITALKRDWGVRNHFLDLLSNHRRMRGTLEMNGLID